MKQFEQLRVGHVHVQRLHAPRGEPATQTQTPLPQRVQPPTAPAAAVQPNLDPVLICLLGSFQVLSHGEQLLVRGSKVEAILRLLALRHSEGVARDEILAQLWPDRDHALAVQSLNSLVYGVQRLLREPLQGAPAIVHEDGTYRLNHDAGIDVDVLHFDALVSTGRRLMRANDPVGAHLAFSSAAGLYRGDLRVGSGVAEIIERERLRASYLTALAHLADYSFARDEYADTLEYAERILAADPCREDAHRLVMRCRVRRGERAQALRQFRLCEDVLRAEFDALPEPATCAIYYQVRLNPAGV